MGHSHHHHGHSHHEPNHGRAFAIGVALNLGFVGVEFVYGKLAGSLSLVADAGHNLSDVLGLLLAWVAMYLSRRRPTPGRTYGMRRSSILAALINASVLLVALGAITWEAIRRFSDPTPVASQTVMAVAGAGIVVNAITAWLFSAGHDDLNIRGAFLHMAADALVSLGVVIGAVGILYTGWEWLDPAISLVVVGVVLVGTWGLLRDSINLALDAVPESVDMDGIRSYLCNLPDVVDMHDLHVWGMSTTETALTAHLVVASPICDNDLVTRVERELHNRFGIEHATLQVEMQQALADCRCRLSHQ